MERKILDALIQERGAIVSSADCGELEITFARSEGRFFVDDNGMGYVLRMKQWRENAESSLCEIRDQHNADKYGE